MENFYNALVTTMEESGLHLIRDEECCEILALVYQFGTESMTIDPKFNRIVRYAQNRLNLIGGEIVNPELLPILQAKIQELETSQLMTYEENKDLYSKGVSGVDVRTSRLPEWAIKLSEKYNVSLAL